MHGDGPATVRTVTEAGRDIETREDCEQLVRAFYARALSDPVIGFIFPTSPASTSRPTFR